jgi:excisionase family DNA binding protein
MTEVLDTRADVAGADRGQTVSVAEVAVQLRVSPRTVRRYIKAGTLPAELVTTSKGTEWRVPGAAVAAAANVRGSGDVDRDVSEPTGDDRGRPGSGSRDPVRGERGDGAALLRALELLGERDHRIAALEQERYELAGRLGYFQSELEHARETIKALQAPASSSAEPPAKPSEVVIAPREKPPRRSWWRFW